MLLQLAWRNIWRNKRRTLITISAIAFAVFFAAFAISFNKGVFDAMIDGAVRQYFGYAQIHGNGYWEEKSIDNSLAFDNQLKGLPEQVSGVEAVVPRIETFALAAAGDRSTGVLAIGIDPEKEQDLTQVADKIIAGSYLTNPAEHAVIAAEGLVTKLDLELNDTLILLSQGYHGVRSYCRRPNLYA